MKRVEESVYDRESNLYMEQLESYIQTYLQQNYTPQQLQDYLVEKGYDKKSVRQALISVNKKYYDGHLELHTASSSSHVLLTIFLGLIVLCIGVFFYFNYSSSYEFSITLENSDLIQGEHIELNIETTRPVELKTLVLTQTGNLVVQKTDFFSSSLTYTVKLPSDLPAGNYVVDVSIKYDDLRDDKSFSFIVREQEIERNIVDVISPVQESSQQFVAALESGNPLDCQKISNQDYFDECYFILARESLDDSLCAQIVQPSIREKCYFTQVINGNIISCSLLEDYERKAICEDLS